MKNAAFFILSLLVLLLQACNHSDSSQEQGSGPPGDATVSLITTGTQLVPALSNTDSVLILFYKDPYGKDSMRYTRYYRQTGSADLAVVGVLLQQLATPFQEDRLRACRSEGKIYAFAKGRPLQTIYFSRQNDKCTHLYFIHEARYYYFKPNDAWFSLLDSMKPKAKEPKALQ